MAAPPPPPAVGAPLSVGALPRSVPAAPAAQNLFLPPISLSLLALPSPPLLHARFGHLLLFALHGLHSIHPGQDPHRHGVRRIQGHLTSDRAILVLRAWGSRGFVTALLQQIAQQSLPELLLSPLEFQRTFLLHLHPPELLLLLASAGLQVLQASQFLLLP